LGCAVGTHYKNVRPIIERMLHSSLDNVRQAGARQATRAALATPEAVPLVAAAIKGDIEQRRGVAEVYAANVGVAELRTECIQGLKSLFDDEDEEIRKIVASCFQNLRENDLIELQNLVHFFVQSRAFRSGPMYLLHAIEESNVRIDELACSICEKFIEVFGDSINDGRTGIDVDGYTVRDLALRIYGQAIDPTVRLHCLNIIDGLCRYNSFSIEGALVEFER
jgi:hypothetical protein